MTKKGLEMKLHTLDLDGSNTACGLSVNTFSLLHIVNYRIFANHSDNHNGLDRCVRCVEALKRENLPHDFYSLQAQLSVAAGNAADLRCGSN